MTPLTKDQILRKLHDYRKGVVERGEKVTLPELAEFLHRQFIMVQESTSGGHTRILIRSTSASDAMSELHNQDYDTEHVDETQLVNDIHEAQEAHIDDEWSNHVTNAYDNQ